MLQGIAMPTRIALMADPGAVLDFRPHPMASERTKKSLVRKVTLLVKLGESGEGARMSDLVREVKASQATVYRDLKELEDAGLEIERVDVQGERCLRFAASRRSPTLGFDVRTRNALELVRRGLRTIEGTFIEDVFD